MDILVLIGQIIIGLLLLTFLVVIHELGHAIVARRNGVVVEEFGVGFPPRAWARKLSKKAPFKLHELGILSINWLPLGGFVKLQGESDDSNKKGDYGRASLWAKTKILMAGVFMNWIAAAVLFTIIALVGFPKILPDQFHIASDTVITSQPLKIAFIEDNSPASNAGLKKNDAILLVNGQSVKTPEDLMAQTKNNIAQDIKVTLKRDDTTIIKDIKLRDHTSKKQGILGVSGINDTTYRSTWSAPIVGVGTTVQFSAATLKGLGGLVGNLGSGIAAQLSGDKTTREKGSQEISAAGNSVAGPIGILGVIFPAAQEAGLVKLMLLMGIISLTLAVMNVLPIPALDGGRLFVTLIFRAIKKPLTRDKEELINGIGFNFLLFLIVVITVADVFKFF